MTRVIKYAILRTQWPTTMAPGPGLQGMGMAVKEAENRELVAKLHQTEISNTLQQDLLRHMMKDRVEVDMEIDNLMTVDEDDGGLRLNLYFFK